MVNVCGFLFCVTRGISYLPWYYSNENLGMAVRILTSNGDIMWLWSGLWFVAAALFVWDMFVRGSHKGMIVALSLMTAWGAGYAMAGVIETIELGVASRQFMTAGTYIFPAGMIFGMLMKVSRLRLASAPFVRDPEVR